MRISNCIAIIDDHLSEEFCIDLIRLHASNKEDQYQGRVSSGVSTFQKNTTDLDITDHVLATEYSELCTDGIKMYLSKLTEHFDYDWETIIFNSFEIAYTFTKIGKYKKNDGHYRAIHQERDGSPKYNRMFVCMSYLNDVFVGGETMFHAFDMKVTPKRGTMLIWPAGMPYFHSGLTPISNDKYIITNWLEQVDPRIEQQ